MMVYLNEYYYDGILKWILLWCTYNIYTVITGDTQVAV